MPKGLTCLLSGDDLKPAFASRSRQFDEKTVSAGSADALSLKLLAEQADGWTLSRRNKSSLRLMKSKPIDRQLEDDIWCLFYKMGFKELNSDRNFGFLFDDKAPARQLDVVAKDDETIFIVECTHSRETGPKSVKSLIDKINAIRDEVIKAVHTHFGREKKLKVKFAIATRNMEWREADRQRAESGKIAIIEENDLKYFKQLTDILKVAARYQFLGRYMRGEKVDGLRDRVPATRGRVGKRTFYNFLMSPHDLLRIAFISHMAKSSNDDLETYQRMVKPSRLKAIGNYIDDGGTFPTNIVINFKADEIPFDLSQSFGDTATGILTLPGQYGSAWVIDGQHRLYGYAYARREAEDDRSVVSVLAYENMSVRDEIEMFLDINTQQVKVSRNLVNEIVSSLNINDDDPKKQMDAICARVALGLDSAIASPLKDRVITVAQEKTHFRCITLTSLADGVFENRLVGTIHKTSKTTSVLQSGPLSDVGGNPTKTLKKSTDALALFYGLFAQSIPEHWALGDDKGGYLCTNLGLRALTQLFAKLIQFTERDGTKTYLLEPEEIISRIRTYALPLIKYFQIADPSDIARFRNRGSSLASVDQNCLQMMAIIAEQMPDFNLPEVRKYVESQDAEGTKLARELIDEINGILFENVIGKLKEKYGVARDAWWTLGVPKTVRNDCDRLFNESDGELDRWRYMYLVNYADIVTYGDNWDLFKDHYNFYGKGPKAQLVRWIGKLNKARQITHHAEKGPLSKEQVAFVSRVHELVKVHIERGELVDPKAKYLVEGASSQEVAA